MINGLSRGKQERKKYFSLSFFQPISLSLDSERWEFTHSICSQIQTVPIRTRCLCLLCRGKGHVHIIKSTGSRREKRLLSKGISQKPSLTDDLAGVRYKKNLPSLKENSFSCIRHVWQYCFPKNRIVLPRASHLFPETHPTLLLRAQCILLLRILLCFVVDFNKRLEVIPRIGPIAVSCHSSSV